jgi:hypothetical protein
MALNQRERLAICSTCINRKLDFEVGYVCQLTGRVADFKVSCKDYVLDETVTDDIKIRTEDRPFVPLFDPVPAPEELETKKKAEKKGAVRKFPVKKGPVKKGPVKKEPAIKNGLSEVALKKLRRYQSFLYALIGGLLITVVSSLAWAFVTAVTGTQGVYMALGVGLLVGIAVRYFGAGINRIFGILAALLALAGSLLGYYLSQAGFPEEVQLASMIKIPESLSPDLMFNTLRDTFGPLDLLFYSLAALLAYLLAIRRISSRKRIKLEGEGYKGAPALHWLRLPLILAGILIPAYFGYTLAGQESGQLKTLYYESGIKMSEGEMHNGLETGEWNSWHENGNIKSTGYYVEGRKDSLWQWYDESGILTGTGMYDEDMENGTWIHYYPDGVISDSGPYLDGLKEGLWEYYYENGNLKYSVNYKAGNMHGETILLNSSGDVIKVEHFENGVLVEKD